MKRRFWLLAAALPALAGAPSSSQTRDEGDLQTFTVLQVDPTASEIVVRETGSTRNRTLELDDRTALFGGALGGRATLQDLHPGDVIRAPGVAGSVSDRVRAEQIQILSRPRGPGDEAAGVGGPGDARERRPSAMDPPTGDGGALDRDPIDRPGALGAEPGNGPGALGTDPRAEPGRVGTDPGASDDESRGTGSPAPGVGRPGEGTTRGGARPGAGSGGSAGSGGGGGSGSSGGSGGGGSGSGGGR